MLTDAHCHPHAAAALSVPEGVPAETLVLLPMVITQIDEQFGCVSAITPEGRWVRPEPIFTRQVIGTPQAPASYQYRQAFRCAVAPGMQDDRRPEDHHLVQDLSPPDAAPFGQDEALAHWMARHTDPSVIDAFAGERSVGMVTATPQRLYLQRSTRNRVFVRLAFVDATGTAYDWIVPDVAFSHAVLRIMRDQPDQEAIGERLLAILAGTRLFIAAALTKPNHRFPGVFRGCQPLVGGVHTFPDYRPLFEAAYPVAAAVDIANTANTATAATATTTEAAPE
ncbi:hypothetical protein [Roseateles amylovorans]|uniref:Uncharacterized protein n=1 Tax=Roseateles amylovorans TaxID=2978473 RepID=A0ABY6AS77_9BURK|nr:hypothetical protein [Roseateles amylovorans]UXH76091.1 hypothetical protein N4261_13505 [Roseateles amylovorans]